jgi:hypothetical protein
MATAEKQNSTIDPTLTLEQVKSRIHELFAQGAAHDHQIGQLYNHVVDNKLAEKSGYKSARDYFSQHVRVLSQSTLSLYGAVAQAFTGQDCARYGTTNLGVLLTYMEAASRWMPEEGPGQVPIDIPQEDGTVLTRPFAECSVAELKLAVKHKRQPTSGTPLPVADGTRVENLRHMLAQRFARSYRVKVQARVTRGRTFVSVMNVPLEELDTLTEVLMDGMAPPLRVAG